MATANYRLQGKNNPTRIYLRFKHSNKFDCEVSTELEINRNHWSSSKQKIKPLAEAYYRTEVNNHLNKLKAVVVEKYTLDNSQGIPITSKWLKNVINGYFKRPTGDINKDNEVFLRPFIKGFISYSKNRTNPKTGKKLKNRTIQHYQTTLNKLVEFQEKTNVNLKLIDIDIPFHTNFIEFLAKEHKLNPNTIGGYIDDIKTFLNYAVRRGFKVNNSFKDPDFYSPQNETFDIAFTSSEIENITTLELKKNSYLDNARDWLIIGIWTGLRISDFLKLTEKKLSDGYIYLKNYKTGVPVVIPILDGVQEVLDKRNGKLPRKISDQNFNKYIKEVSKKAGMTNKSKGGKINPETCRKEIGIYPRWQLVSSHTCRRTFATMHYGKIDTLTIMKITGHKTEQQFLDYIKVTPKEYADRLKKYYNDINKEKSAQLKVV